MSFPASPIDVRTELNLNGTWTDISQYCQKDPVVIGRGHPDESTTTAPSTLTLTLANETGRFTSKNPASPYYPNLKRNTQCRVSIPSSLAGINCYLRLETDQASYASCPDSTALQITTGTLSIRIDCLITDWRQANLISKYGSTLTAQAWALQILGSGLVTLFHVDGSGAGHSAVSTLPVPYFNARIALRADYNIGAQTVTFYTAPTMSGSWTQLGAVTTTPATTQAAGTGQPIEVGGASGSTSPGMYGQVYEAQIWSTSTLEADPVFTSQTPGATSFSDGHSNTWTLSGTSELSGRMYRGHFEVPSWPQQQDPTGLTVYVPIEGGGVLRRVSQRQTSVNSPMYRAYVRLPSSLNLAAYWPAEDGSDATQIGPAVGVHAMTNTGLTMSSSTDFVCSAAVPVMNGGTASGLVNPASVTWTANIVRFLLAVPAADDTVGAVVCQFTTTGTIATVQLIYGGTGNWTLNCYNAAGTNVSTGGISTGLPALAQCRLSVELTQSGGNVVPTFLIITPGSASAGGGVNPTVAGTVGSVTSVAFGGGLVTSAMGHFSVQGGFDDIRDLAQPLNAWSGETAGNRVSRLCGEEGLSCRVVGAPDTSAAMSYQTIETITQLLQECADADLGMLTEPRHCGPGLGYRTRSSIGNVSAVAGLSFNSDHMDVYTSPPLEDDQIIVNDVTVSQTTAGASSTGGPTARLYAASGQPIDGGRLNVNEPNATPSGVGRYDQTYTVNVPSAALLNNAGMRLYAGTIDEPRYPGIGIDLANTALASFIPSIALLDLGDRLTIADPQMWLSPGLADAVDEIVNGYTETLWVARTWQLSVQGIPYTAYPVGIVADATYGWIDTDGSQIQTAATYGASTIKVQRNSSSYAFWSTNGADYPFFLQCQGMVIAVSGCSGASDPQTFTVSQWGVNGVQVNLSAGSDIRLAYPAILGM